MSIKLHNLTNKSFGVSEYIFRNKYVDIFKLRFYSLTPTMIAFYVLNWCCVFLWFSDIAIVTFEELSWQWMIPNCIKPTYVTEEIVGIWSRGDKFFRSTWQKIKDRSTGCSSIIHRKFFTGMCTERANFSAFQPCGRFFEEGCTEETAYSVFLVQTTSGV